MEEIINNKFWKNTIIYIKFSQFLNVTIQVSNIFTKAMKFIQIFLKLFQFEIHLEKKSSTKLSKVQGANFVGKFGLRWNSHIDFWRKL